MQRQVLSGTASGACLRPVHTCVAGRLRVHIDGFKGWSEACNVLRALLLTREQFKSATVSALTGNATVTFPQTIPAERILSELRACVELIPPVADPPARETEWHAL